MGNRVGSDTPIVTSGEKARVGVGHDSRDRNSGQEAICDLGAGAQSHWRIKNSKKKPPGFISAPPRSCVAQVQASGRATVLHIHH
jgi:hypothetical protein